MSIDSVIAKPDIALGSVQSNELAARSERVRVASLSRGSASGTQPNRESPAARKQTKEAELPQDEVQVQRDGQNQIVIKYLDSSGKMIFQVPSSQILALQQAIEQALEEHSRSGGNGNGRCVISAGGVRNEH